MTQTETNWVITYTIVPAVNAKAYQSHLELGLTIKAQNRLFHYFPLHFAENAEYCTSLELDRSLLSFVDSLCDVFPPL